ncbi:putative COLICIN V SECRETION ABC TRANSPORTER [Vibrio chagasii]|nr:putative COLICIN V SECRETION ABC TRANSPORTER [Vibrio chagasii]CDT48329.1 putative COLICIN V SECRETION ABC TRANSPORTER [Vibrio coralliirubri]
MSTSHNQRTQSMLGHPHNLLHRLHYTHLKRVPLVMQSEVSECALACVAMISGYYGYQINVASLRRMVRIGTQGMNLKQVMELASRIRLTARAVQCEVEELDQLSLPCIIHWDLNHFVVLTKVCNGKVDINDPAQGKRQLSTIEFARSFTGIALELHPNSNFKKQDKRETMRISQLWEKVHGLKRTLVTLLMLSVVIQAAALIAPYYMQWVVDNVLLSHDTPLLMVLALGFALLNLIKTGVTAFRSWFVVRFSSALNIQMGANLFHHLIRLPNAYFEKRHVGDVVSRFGSINAIRELLTTGIVEALIDGLMASVVLIMMFLYSPLLTGVVLAVVGLSFVVQWLFYFPNRRITEESIVAEAKEDSHFLESIRAIQTIKIFSHETHRQNSWLNRYAEVINTDIQLGKLDIAETTLNDLIFGLEMVIVVYLGALIVIEGELTVGMLLAFIAYKNQFTTSILAFIDKILSFKLLTLHLERLSDITLHTQENSLGQASLPLPVKGHIKVENVSFRYFDQAPWVLNQLSFEIEPGESIAITGESGCGKTTLLKLLLGLLSPTTGTIYLDGIDIQKLDKTTYRSHLGSVMQNDTLLSGTLSENITMFDSPYDEERLKESCRHANILAEIQRLPLGFYSLVGDMGSSFSGGQLQRIFLARALYKQPKVLCLDESTSHLDANNEAIINQHVQQLNITRIIIAHRAETIASATRTIHLEKPQ